MAKNTIADLDVTAANNTDVLGQSTAGSANANTLDTIVQNILGLLARFYDDLGGVNTVGGTANAVTVTLASAITAYASGQFFAFKNTVGPNTAAATMDVNSIGIKKIRAQGDTALAGGEMLDDGVYLLRYDSSYDAAAGAWVLLNPNSVLLSGAQTVAGVKTFSSNPVLSGGGISFPSSQEGSADANTLDDYEEGTWTPGIAFGGGTTGITYLNQVGTYTKAGRFCTVSANLRINSNGSSTGIATITGLPFPSLTLTNMFWSPALGYSSIGAFFWSLGSNSSVITCDTYTEANFVDGTQIFFTLTYETAS